MLPINKISPKVTIFIQEALFYYLLPGDWFQEAQAIDQRASSRSLDSISSTLVTSPAAVTALYRALETPSPWIGPS